MEYSRCKTMEDWRNIYTTSSDKQDGQKCVQCTVCKKLLIHSSKTWGTMKRHADRHILKGQFHSITTPTYFEVPGSLQAIRHRECYPQLWRSNYCIPEREEDVRITCKECGTKLKNSNQNWKAIKSHALNHMSMDIVKLSSLPSPVPQFLFYHVVDEEEYLKEKQYAVEFKTEPRLRGWISEHSFRVLKSQKGLILINPNRNLIRKINRKRVAKTAHEVLAEFDTIPIVRCWITKDNLRLCRLKTRN